MKLKTGGTTRGITIGTLFLRGRAGVILGDFPYIIVLLELTRSGLTIRSKIPVKSILPDTALQKAIMKGLYFQCSINPNRDSTIYKGNSADLAEYKLPFNPKKTWEFLDLKP